MTVARTIPRFKRVDFAGTVESDFLIAKLQPFPESEYLHQTGSPPAYGQINNLALLNLEDHSMPTGTFSGLNWSSISIKPPVPADLFDIDVVVLGLSPLREFEKKQEKTTVRARLSEITLKARWFREKLTGFLEDNWGSSTSEDDERFLYNFEQLTSLEADIYVKFYPIKHVQSVYTQELDEVYNTFVFLQQDEYDEDLMDKLLEREWEILETHQDTLFNFYYLPLLSGPPEQSIPDNVIQLFSRSING